MWLHAIVLAALSMTGLSFRSDKSLDKSAKDTLGSVMVIAGTWIVKLASKL